MFTAKPQRHTSQDFVAFLEEVVAQCPAMQQIHIILDNLSAHKTRLVDEFLSTNSRIHFHFTPTYSSWLNQVELWFGKIERDLIARGVFTSVTDLALKIRRYIKAYSANAKPIQWKYSDPTRRIRSNEFTATGHKVAKATILILPINRPQCPYYPADSARYARRGRRPGK